MIPISRRAPACSAATTVTLLLCGPALVLGVLGTPSEPAGAAAIDLRESFALLDDNRDGVIGREEFLRNKTQIFYRALTDLDRDQSVTRGELNLTPQAFADADLDGDGKLSGAEFVQARFMQFEAMDANGDQEITSEEFRAFISPYLL